VAVASSLVNRLGISNRPRRTGITNYLSAILIWPARLAYSRSRETRIIAIAPNR
jgi:hypothetical protein